MPETNFKPRPNKDGEYKNVGLDFGQTLNVASGCTFWKIVDAQGEITVAFETVDGPTQITRVKGDQGFMSQIRSMRIKSTVANDTLVLTLGGYDERSQPNSAAVVPGSIKVQGEHVPDVTGMGGGSPATDSPASFGNQVLAGMVKDNGDGTWSGYPLQTYDRNALEVGLLDSRAAFVYTVDNTPGNAFSCFQYGCVRMSITNPGDKDLLIADIFGAPLIAYTQAGAILAEGTIPAGTSGVVYIPVIGAGAVLMQAAPGGATPWGVRISASPRAYVPMKA